MSFEKAFKIILSNEGGFSDVAGDRGGATMMGIIQVTYDAYRAKHGLPKQAVRNIQKSEVEDIYRMQYWNPCKCDQLPLKTAIALVDYAVNSGVGRACKALQVCLGFQGRDIDGILGRKSFAAVAKWKDEALAETLLEYRRDFFRRIIKNDPSQRKFEGGWMNRIENMRKCLYLIDKISIQEVITRVYGKRVAERLFG